MQPSQATALPPTLCTVPCSLAGPLSPGGDTAATTLSPQVVGAGHGHGRRQVGERFAAALRREARGTYNVAGVSVMSRGSKWTYNAVCVAPFLLL